jgi:hypothetical protein
MSDIAVSAFKKVAHFNTWGHLKKFKVISGTRREQKIGTQHIGSM